MSKKSRGPNFCANEKEILIQLIMKHKNIVENKKNYTTALKNEGWKVLTEELNSLSSFNVRNTELLKTCWDNLKRTSRKEKALTKKDIFLTGGGRPNNPPPGPFQGQIDLLLGPTLDGLPNEFDSDFHFQEEAEIIIVPNNVNTNLADVLPAIATDKLDTMSGCTNVDDIAVPSGLKSSQPEVEELNKQDSDASSRRNSENKENIWNGCSPAALKTKMSDALATQKRAHHSFTGEDQGLQWPII